MTNDFLYKPLVSEFQADQPAAAKEPEYSLLFEWLRDWPDARPEIFDFWGRGGYLGRIMNRQLNPRPAITVSVQFLDEMDTVLRRIALMGLEVDFLWHGRMSKTGLVLAPQAADYNGVGGWGYNACAGDELLNKKSEREWVPALGVATLMPDTVTDWIAERAGAFFRDGQAYIIPSKNAGVIRPNRAGEVSPLDNISISKTVARISSALKIVENLDLVYLDKMNLADVAKFRSDYSEELARFQTHIAELLQSNEEDVDRVTKELRDSVDEIKRSRKHANMRNLVIALGGVLATVNIGLASGLSAQLLGSGVAAQNALHWWLERDIFRKTIRRDPVWPVWELSRGRKMGSFKKDRLVHDLGFSTLRSTENKLCHWLAPPSSGWGIPTGFLPK